MLRQCKECGAEFHTEKVRGYGKRLCSEKCREVWEAGYHQEYDSRPDQLTRRRDYMRSIRNKERRKARKAQRVQGRLDKVESSRLKRMEDKRERKELNRRIVALGTQFGEQE